MRLSRKSALRGNKTEHGFEGLKLMGLNPAPLYMGSGTPGKLPNFSKLKSSDLHNKGENLYLRGRMREQHASLYAELGLAHSYSFYPELTIIIYSNSYSVSGERGGQLSRKPTLMACKCDGQ